MINKTLQKKWYEALENDGFEDIEDHSQEGVPLKQWSSRAINLSDKELSDLMDKRKHQKENEPMTSNYPETIFDKKENFMAHVEFRKVCAFICRHGNSTLTPGKCHKIWQLHCDGVSERAIGSILGIDDNKVHRSIETMTEWMDMMTNRDSNEAYEEVPESVIVVIREYVKEQDTAFVIASWRNNLWFATGLPDSESNEFYRQANKRIKSLLSSKYVKVKVACLSDDQDHIVGCSVLWGHNIEWVYVKIDYRKQGIAKLLCKGFKTVSPPQTEIGKAIVKDHGYKVRQIKGELNGNNNDGKEKKEE